MPVLPSGKTVSLVPQIRMLNAIQTAPASGYFWIDSPADLQDFGPLQGSGEEGRTSRQVRFPKSIEDLKKFITVVVSDESGGPEIFKFNLVDFPPASFLSDADKVVWLNWLESQPVQLSLEMHLAECFDQVEYFDRLRTLGVTEEPETLGKTDFSGGFDLFLEREPLEEKKQRHTRYLKRAEEYLKQLKAMHVNDPLVQVTWVDLLMEEFAILKAWKDGEEFFRRRYAAHPEQIEFHVALLKCIFEQNRYTEVEEALWEAVGQFPQRPEYWNLLIHLYLNQQSYKKALETTNMALSINPEGKDLLENKFLCETAIRKMEDK